MSSAPSFLNMLQSLQSSLPEVRNMILAFAYAGGTLFLLKALFNMRQWGYRNMMGSQVEMMKPMWYLIAASMLFFTPTALNDLVIGTIFGSPNILNYTAKSSSDWSQSMGVIIGVIQIVGLSAFVRGWFHIVKSNNGGGGGGFGKGMTHLVGGACAVNIMGMKALLFSTFGLMGATTISF